MSSMKIRGQRKTNDQTEDAKSSLITTPLENPSPAVQDAATHTSLETLASMQ